MNLLGYIAVFFISAISIFLAICRHQQKVDLNTIPTFLSTTSNEIFWDQENRRRIDSVFFVDAPEWSYDSEDKATTDTANASTEVVSSGVQSNPFTE